jgi:hypothetical protein
MKSRLFFLFLILVFALSVMAHAQDADDDDDDNGPPKPSVMRPTDKPAGARLACPYDKDFQQPHKIAGYTLRLLPSKKDRDDKDNDGDPRCRAILISPSGKKITVAQDWALGLDKISGSDLNADGKPELVLDGYTGGLHCCYTYLIISLGSSPQAVRALRSQLPMIFAKQADGTALIHADDGIFDYFLLPHSDAVIPKLVLKMEGNNLVDVSAHFPKAYDEEIEQARSQLTSLELEKFRQSNYRDRLFMDQASTVHKVLTIVLDYLYSGREAKAWEVLNELWPPPDVARVKSLIVERRDRGLLAELAKRAPKAPQEAKITN